MPVLAAGRRSAQISEFLHEKALARKKSRGSSYGIVSGADHASLHLERRVQGSWRLGVRRTLPKGQIPIAKRKKKKRKPKIIVVDDDDNSVEDVLDATPFSPVASGPATPPRA